jgi:ABC-2 type transport system ATP-binding protein
VVVGSPNEASAERALTQFGERVPSKPGTVAIRLPGGAAELPKVVRVLDDAGVAAEAMEVTMPSLDDVFADATGRRLEGAGSGDAGPDEPTEEAASA